MILKTFILDSETKLILEHTKSGYIFMVAGQPITYGVEALQSTQNWINDFGVRYPGYATKMQRHFDDFIRT
jgi:hypothetical protein